MVNRSYGIISRGKFNCGYIYLSVNLLRFDTNRSRFFFAMQNKKQIPEDGLLPAFRKPGRAKPDNIMLVRMPKNIEGWKQTHCQIATLNRKGVLDWPCDDYVDHLMPALKSSEVFKVGDRKREMKTDRNFFRNKYGGRPKLNNLGRRTFNSRKDNTRSFPIKNNEPTYMNRPHPVNDESKCSNRPRPINDDSTYINRHMVNEESTGVNEHPINNESTYNNKSYPINDNEPPSRNRRYPVKRNQAPPPPLPMTAPSFDEPFNSFPPAVGTHINEGPGLPGPDAYGNNYDDTGMSNDPTYLNNNEYNNYEGVPKYGPPVNSSYENDIIYTNHRHDPVNELHESEYLDDPISRRDPAEVNYGGTRRSNSSGRDFHEPNLNRNRTDPCRRDPYDAKFANRIGHGSHEEHFESSHGPPVMEPYDRIPGQGPFTNGRYSDEFSEIPRDIPPYVNKRAENPRNKSSFNCDGPRVNHVPEFSDGGRANFRNFETSRVKGETMRNQGNQVQRGLWNNQRNFRRNNSHGRFNRGRANYRNSRGASR